jgi:2-amino-4-hydroxy-6-hydroxymethyldihydropteridine diphosphokinase
MNVTYLCLGGNIGEREKAIYLALLEISQLVGEITSQSKIYETEAWGVENQQAYLNQCVEVKTLLSANELITALLSIEQHLGRIRSLNEVYEPRTIDIDILFYDQEVIDNELLKVPHPRLHLRKFVLIPLNEICSNYLHPLLNTTIFNLLSHCEDESEVKLFKSER